jgi:DNA-binding response OmpR family regulator
MGTILVIEDDARIIKALQRLFSSEGYEIRSANNGKQGLEMFAAPGLDAVVLDLMLPGMSGRDICRSMKQANADIPVVILSAISDVADKVLLLELGADDYVTKPFRIRELVARANAFLRRAKAQKTALVTFGDFELNLTARKLFRQGREVDLTAKEFGLLAYFATRPGRALARNDVLDGVWGHSVIVTPRSIDRCVATLRAKIEPDPHNPTFIQTIRDIGYRFEPE